MGGWVSEGGRMGGGREGVSEWMSECVGGSVSE